MNNNEIPKQSEQSEYYKKIKAELWSVIIAVVEPMGFELLEIQVQRGRQRQIIVVRLDRLDEHPISIENLTEASRAAEVELDRLDLISGEYRLEFESPGSKRPLLTARHYERMLGLRARVRSVEHQFTAPIKEVQGDQVSFDVGGELVVLTIGSFQGNLAEFPDRHR